MMVFKNYFQQERVSHVDNIVVTATTIDVINSGGVTTLEGNFALVLVMFYFCHLIFFFFFYSIPIWEVQIKNRGPEGPEPHVGKLGMIPNSCICCVNPGMSNPGPNPVFCQP